MSVVTCRCSKDTPILNGSTAATEGARLRFIMKSCPPQPSRRLGNLEPCCSPPTPTVQPTITPCESSRILGILQSCSGSSPSGQVTQDRAKALLAQFQANQVYTTETARIVQKVQDTLDCSTNPFSEETRFSIYNRLPAAEVCPPLPPPPAPPARACPLSKDRKF